jgi:hypothetical protein
MLIWFDPTELERIPRPLLSAPEPSRRVSDAPSASPPDSSLSIWDTWIDLNSFVDTIFFFWD